MKRWLLVLPLVAISGCSQTSESTPHQRTESHSIQVAPAALESAADASGDAAAGPKIGVTAAPGVAFNYRYDFRVPNAKISTVQEQHAQMCEKLGINRCRITGLRYRLRDEDSVEALLALKLDPVIARQFGKDAIAHVSKAEGMVVDTEITGEDKSGIIKGAARNIATLGDELARIEARLTQKGLSNEERQQLAEEAAALRDQIRASKAEKTDATESLATTPMVFNYGSGSVIPGFDGSSPITDAFATAVRSFVTMLGFIIVAIGVVVPWLALLLGLRWLWRRFGTPGLFRRQASTEIIDQSS